MTFALAVLFMFLLTVTIGAGLVVVAGVDYMLDTHKPDLEDYLILLLAFVVFLLTFAGTLTTTEALFRSIF
ncbi:hypothetical protein GS454_04600 [Rhodococcus hoagii]|nr:hypothetical protein [Prescottella equi]